MKKRTGSGRSTDMRAEYVFDYRKSLSNRFASRIHGIARTVVLDPDVASRFKTSKSVNDALRSILRKRSV